MIGTTAALIATGIAAAGGTATSAVVGSKAAGKAADAQTQAANYSATLQKEAADDSLNFQKEVYADQKQNARPYVEAGRTSLADLSAGLAPGGEFTTTYDASKLLADDPGYDFRLSEGLKAVKSAASATGTLGSGATLKALSRYGQDYASGEYNNVWNRFQTDRSNRFNRLASLAGVGQTATGQVSAAGSNAASNIASISANAARGISDSVADAANATASGYIGQANTMAGAVGSGINNVTNLLTLSQLGKLSQIGRPRA